MKRVLIIFAGCILVGLIGVAILSYLGKQEDEHRNNLQVKIDTLLTDEDYAGVFALYGTENEKFHVILNTTMEAYVNELCEESIDNLSPDKLIKLRDAGGNYVIVIDTINQIEAKLAELEESSNNYAEAVAVYNNRQFEAAREGFEAVIADDENYQNALEYIAELDVRTNSWDNNISGKSSYVNAVSYDGEYLYVPFALDGVDGIYKIESQGTAVDFFPLSDGASRLIISGINIVGDYIYFIAGENVGNGYTFKNPYSIYEMKTDGTDLSLVMGGNFTDLYIKDDKVYAVSREFGLVQYSRDFVLENVISDGIVSEFSFADNGIYYTVKADLTHNNVNSLYFYDYQESKLIEDERYLHLYKFDSDYIKYWKHNSVFESLYFGNDANEIRIRVADIYKVYGKIGNQILYSCNGSVGRETMYIYNLSSGSTDQLNDNTQLLDYKVNSVFYEGGKTIIEKDNKLYFADIRGESRQEIPNGQVNAEMLKFNKAVIKYMQADDIYTDSNDTKVISVIYDKQNWHYKDNELNLTIEKRYIDEYDTNIYVTHIFTTDYSLLTTGNGNPESLNSRGTYAADIISEKYQTIFAQNTDTFLHDKNVEKGIIIRHGQLVRDIFLEDMMVLFDDGSAEVYEYGDDINAEMLVEKGAATSFSFGPILVEDYSIDTDCVTAYPVERNPRSAIGYFEPGHYVMVACDGRDSQVSRGLTMIQLARIFEDEGCQIAYNLDGGMSTAVLFMGNYVTNRPKYGTSEWFFYRRIAEIFYVGTNEWSPADLSPFTYDYNYFKDNYK